MKRCSSLLLITVLYILAPRLSAQNSQPVVHAPDGNSREQLVNIFPLGGGSCME